MIVPEGLETVQAPLVQDGNERVGMRKVVERRRAVNIVAV